MSDPEDLNDSLSGDDDLFGDGDDGSEVGQSDPEQVLSDLDGDEDEAEDDGANRYRGAEDGEDGPPPTIKVQTVKMFRHQTPKPTDGTLKSLRVPHFITWNPKEYKSATYNPTPREIEDSKEKDPKPVARFRRDAATGELQSNATIYRWDDGSVTLAIGDEHYDVQTKPMAPPANKPYAEVQDAHYYAAAAHLQSNSLITVGHITEQYVVRPNRSEEDAALAVLKKKLAEASRSSQSEENMIIRTTQDPELQKKQAELAEKERERARRRRENAAARLDGNVARFSRGGALSIGDLEGGRKGAGRKRGAPGAARQKRRRPEYDSDDDLPQGKGRQEDYDLEDEFIAPSDEEISEGGDDDEEDILDDDDDEEDERPRTKRKKTAVADDADADADADLDDDVPAAGDASRRGHGRRQIIDDDEE